MRPGRSFADVQHSGDLFVRISFDGKEVQHGPVAVRELGDAAQQFRFGHLFHGGCFGAAELPGRLYFSRVADDIGFTQISQRRIDEYAAELLKPKTTKRASVSSSDIEKLKEEQQLLAAKQREISEKIRQTENSLFIQRNEKIAAAVFKTLGREYMPGDEVRIYEYLAGCDDFKIYMNSKTEETEEENCV